MKVQSNEWVTKRAHSTINTTIKATKIIALFVWTRLGSDLLRIFFSNFVTITLSRLEMSSPMDFNVSKVMGMPSNEMKIHNIFPAGVWGVMFP